MPEDVACSRLTSGLVQPCTNKAVTGSKAGSCWFRQERMLFITAPPMDLFIFSCKYLVSFTLLKLVLLMDSNFKSD